MFIFGEWNLDLASESLEEMNLDSPWVVSFDFLLYSFSIFAICQKSITLYNGHTGTALFLVQTLKKTGLSSYQHLHLKSVIVNQSVLSYQEYILQPFTQFIFLWHLSITDLHDMIGFRRWSGPCFYNSQITFKLSRNKRMSCFERHSTEKRLLDKYSNFEIWNCPLFILHILEKM